VGGHELDSSGSVKQVASFCEHGIEHFDSIETEMCWLVEFTVRFSANAFAPWSLIVC
jgi:hypothetical protein